MSWAASARPILPPRASLVTRATTAASDAVGSAPRDSHPQPLQHGAGSCRHALRAVAASGPPGAAVLPRRHHRSPPHRARGAPRSRASPSRAALSAFPHTDTGTDSDSDTETDTDTDGSIGQCRQVISRRACAARAGSGSTAATSCAEWARRAEAKVWRPCAGALLGCLCHFLYPVHLRAESLSCAHPRGQVWRCGPTHWERLGASTSVHPEVGPKSGVRVATD